MSNIARMTIDVPQGFKNEIKSHAALLGKNLKEYVVEALEAKLQLDEELEDKHLGKLADKAKKGGFMNEKESQNLLDKMNNA